MAERDIETDTDIEGIRGYIGHLGGRIERRDHNEIMGAVFGSEVLQDEVVQAIKMAIRKARLEGVISGMQHATGQDVTLEGEGERGARRNLSSIIEEGIGWNGFEQTLKGK